MAAVFLLVAAMRNSPIPEWRYQRVQMGMSRAQVERIIGKPDRVYTRAAEGNALRDWIGCSPSVSSYPDDKVKTGADEVWRWTRLIDQKMGVVFASDGKVIFKWVDY